MPAKSVLIAVDRFTTFGDLLKYLRRRAGSPSASSRSPSVTATPRSPAWSRTSACPTWQPWRRASCPSWISRISRKQPSDCWSWLPACAAKTPRRSGCPPTRACSISTSRMPSCSSAAKPSPPAWSSAWRAAGVRPALPGDRRRLRQRQILPGARRADPGIALAASPHPPGRWCCSPPPPTRWKRWLPA